MVERTFLIENRSWDGKELLCKHNQPSLTSDMVQGSSLKEGMHTSCIAGILYARKAAEFAGVLAVHALPCAYCQLDCFAYSVGHGPAGQNYTADT